jgi:hypothetical protein
MVRKHRCKREGQASDWTPAQQIFATSTRFKRWYCWISHKVCYREEEESVKREGGREGTGMRERGRREGREERGENRREHTTLSLSFQRKLDLYCWNSSTTFVLGSASDLSNHCFFPNKVADYGIRKIFVFFGTSSCLDNWISYVLAKF